MTKSKIIRISVSLLAGLLFGMGMIISEMVNPAKVIGFLDITGNWAPSLNGTALSFSTLGSCVFSLLRWMPIF